MQQLSITLGRVKGLLKNNPDLSASMLANVAGMPIHRLTAALRGAIRLDSRREAELLSLAMRATKILEAILPLRLVSGDSQTLKQLIDNNREPETIAVSILNLLERVE